MEIAEVLPVAGLLVAITNIVVQVVKKVTWDKVPTNLVALAVALVLTVGTGLAWRQITAQAVTWYWVAGLVVAGFLVAYAAMFGYDKLMEALGWKQ